MRVGGVVCSLARSCFHSQLLEASTQPAAGLRTLPLQRSVRQKKDGWMDGWMDVRSSKLGRVEDDILDVRPPVGVGNVN